MTVCTTPFSDPSVFPAYDFDGSTNYIQKSSNLSGISSSKTGFLSFFFYYSNMTKTLFYANSAGNPIINLAINNLNPTQITCSLSDASGANSWSFKSTNTITINTWYHIMISWDTNYTAGSKVAYIYANDTSLGVTNIADGMGASNVGWADATSWTIGADSGGSTKFDGCMSQFAFYPGGSLDITNSTNRRKFSDSSFHPEFIGEDGSTPTGTPAKVYIGNPISAIGTNKGTGGNFNSVNGTFTVCGTSP